MASILANLAALPPHLQYSAGTVAICGAIGLGKKVWEVATRDPALFTKTDNLVDLAAKGALRGRVHGRDWILRRLAAQIGTARGIVLLHGKPGVGKTALIEEIAHRIHDKAIPELVGAKVLRLKSKEMASASGLIGSANEFLYGTVQDLFKSILDELKMFNLKGNQGKIILFVDEIHRLFTNKMGGFDFTLLMNHLPELDEHGVILVGATSSESLVDSLKNHDRGTGQSLARRIREIEVPEMTPREAIEALQQGREDMGRMRKVALTPEGVEAIVHLTKEHNPDRRGRLPDTAVKFFEEIAQDIRNNHPVGAPPSIDDEAVIQYLHKISPQEESPESFRNKLRQARFEIERTQGFFDQYFPRLEPKQGSPYRPMQDLTFSLSHSLSSSQGQTCLVRTNTHSFVEEAARKLNPAEARFRTISIEKLLTLYKRDPSILPHFIQALARIGDETLLIEESSPLLRELKEKIKAGSSLTEMLAEAPSMEDAAGAVRGLFNGEEAQGWLSQATRLANRGAEAVQKHIGSVPAIPLGLVSSPILEALAAWILKPGHRSVICVSKESTKEAALLESLRWASIDVHSQSANRELEATDVIDWLTHESVDDGTASIEKLVFLIYRFWPFQKKTASPDLCYEIFKQMGPFPWSDQALIDAIFAKTGGAIRKDEMSELLTGLGELNRNQPVEPCLSQVFPPLSYRIDDALEAGASLIEIEGADRIKGKYLKALIAKHLEQGQIPLIDFSLLAKLFPHREQQMEYLKRVSFKCKRAFIFVDHKDLTPSVEHLMQNFHQLGFSILCAAPHRENLQRNRESKGIVEQAIDQGSKILQKVVGQTENAPPPNWMQEAFTKLKYPPFQENQFREFFFYLLKELSPHHSVPMKEALCKAYFALYESQENGLSLDRIALSLKADLNKPLKTKAKIASHLFTKFGKSSSLSEEDLLFAIDPSSTTPIHRMKKWAIKTAKAALEILFTPINFATSYTGRGIESIGSWLGGATLFAWIRGYFGG